MHVYVVQNTLLYMYLYTGAESFTLTCKYNASDGEVTEDMFWAVHRESDDGYVKVANSTRRENTVTIMTNDYGNVTEMTVSRPGIIIFSLIRAFLLIKPGFHTCVSRTHNGARCLAMYGHQ